MADAREQITGVVLAGGRGRRMGGADKGLVEFQGRPLAAYALDALRLAAGPILINANRNREAYARLGFPVVADRTDSFDGPLAGLLSALEAAQTEYVLTVPCDCPLIDGRLLWRLHDRLVAEKAEICAAHDGGRIQPMFLLVRCRLAEDLAAYLTSGQRKVETWLKAHRLALADYRDHPQLFANANTLEELADLATSGSRAW